MLTPLHLEGGLYLAALRGAGAGQVVRVIVAQRQEALQARAGVVRPLTVIAVRQRDHQTGLLAPSLLACMEFHNDLRLPQVLTMRLLRLLRCLTHPQPRLLF